LLNFLFFQSDPKEMIVRRVGQALLTAAGLMLFVSVLWWGPEAVVAQEASAVAEGKKIAFDRRKGNCLACHMMDDGELPGNIGPPLIAMKARYPDKATLRAQIYDARTSNPNTVMPPFGPHAVISEEEIDKVTDYVYTL
jgi:sulfur-oxidizing protein SoxX